MSYVDKYIDDSVEMTIGQFHAMAAVLGETATKKGVDLDERTHPICLDAHAAILEHEMTKSEFLYTLLKLVCLFSAEALGFIDETATVFEAESYLEER